MIQFSFILRLYTLYVHSFYLLKIHISNLHRCSYFFKLKQTQIHVRIFLHELYIVLNLFAYKCNRFTNFTVQNLKHKKKPRNHQILSLVNDIYFRYTCIYFSATGGEWLGG